MEPLQAKLLNWGAKKTLLILTLLAIAASLLLTYCFVTLIWGDDPIYKEFLVGALLTAIAVPALIAPVITHYILKLLFKVYALEKQTRALATYDVLTGLLSRRAFYEAAEQQLKMAIRSQHALAIMVADLDGFKSINDTYGHYVGDQVLKKVGLLIAENARESDLVGRVGGDEFVFCLPNANQHEAQHLGQRLIDAINRSEFNYEGNNVALSASIGLHVKHVQSGELLRDLIHEADVALYQAKQEGKGRLR